MPELEIGLIDERELNFNQLFPQFKEKKKIQVKNYSPFDFKC